MQRHSDPLVTRDLKGLEVPGVIVVVSPTLASQMGAMREDAVSEEDAWEAKHDLSVLDEEQGRGD